MGPLDNLLEPTIRGPAACLIEVGTGRASLGDLASLVKTVEVATSRTEAAAATIVFEDRRKEDGTYVVADSGLLERWQPVSISADFGTYAEEILRGYITQIAPTFPENGGEVTLELAILDEAALLDRDHQRRVWGKDVETTDKQIAMALLADSPVTLDPASGDGMRGRTLNQDATPIRFLRERAAANGYELLMTPGMLYFGPRRLDGTPQPPLMIYAGTGTNCLTFAVSDDGMTPDAIEYEVAPEKNGTAAVTEIVTADLRDLGKLAANAEGATAGVPFVQKMSRSGDEPAEVARARAQALADEASFKLRATGEADGALYGHVLRPGLLVEVDGAGTRYGGLYYTDKVVHRFSETGYRQAFELMRNATGPAPAGASAAPLSAAASAIANLF